MQKAVCVKATNAAVFALAVQAAEPTTECIRDGGDFVALALSTPRHIANYDEVCTRTIAKALEFQVRNTYFVNEDVLKAGQYHLGIVASNLFRLGRAAADAAKKGSSQRCRDDAAASKAEHASLLKILKNNAFHAAIDSGGTWASLMKIDQRDGVAALANFVNLRKDRTSASHDGHSSCSDDEKLGGAAAGGAADAAGAATTVPAANSVSDGVLAVPLILESSNSPKRRSARISDPCGADSARTIPRVHYSSRDENEVGAAAAGAAAVAAAALAEAAASPDPNPTAAPGTTNVGADPEGVSEERLVCSLLGCEKVVLPDSLFFRCSSCKWLECAVCAIKSSLDYGKCPGCKDIFDLKQNERYAKSMLGFDRQIRHAPKGTDRFAPDPWDAKKPSVPAVPRVPPPTAAAAPLFPLYLRASDPTPSGGEFSGPPVGAVVQIESMAALTPEVVGRQMPVGTRIFEIPDFIPLDLCIECEAELDRIPLSKFDKLVSTHA